jgi:hypothetical protein
LISALSGVGSLQLLDVAVHAIESVIPDVPVLLGPTRDIGERGGVDGARPKLGSPAASDQASVLKHFDVLGDRWKRKVKRGCEIVDAGLALSEAGEYRSPRRVRQRRKSFIEPCIPERCRRH